MRTLATAEIVAVGAELLTPHRIDTNSLFLSARLNELGIDVRAKGVIGDDRDQVAQSVRDALGRVDVVILTGGLGPTEDDVTREAVAIVLDRTMEEDSELLDRIRARFAKRGIAMPENNRRQAQVPRGALILPNSKGTAPGLWIDAGDQVVVLLPGPPRELEPMFAAEVTPRLSARSGARRLVRRTIKMTGRPESQVDQIASPVYSPMLRWLIPVRTTILASPGQIELHLSAEGNRLEPIDRALDDAVRALQDALGPIVFSVDGRSLAEVVGALLRERGARIAVAESCTGGLMLGRLTDVPGSSDYVVGGVVAYANEVKIAQLGVPAAVLEEYGAVSEAVAAAMADGVRVRLGADVGVGVTGIAGPSGGTAAKPVGLVVIAVAGPVPAVRTFNFVGDREMIRIQAVQAALDMVRRMLIGP